MWPEARLRPCYPTIPIRPLCVVRTPFTPMADLTIHVRTGPGARHPIRIGAGLAARLATPVHDACSGASRIYVASSPRVWRLVGPTILRGLKVPATRVVLVNDGERAKTLGTMTRILDALVADGADRKAVLVAVGGGVLGDMAGFAAASFLRGIRLVHVPTTVVGQVDSAIGGKVGVNHRLGKNLIGAFHQPSLVAIDPTLLATLSRRELRAGLYEVVKYAVIASAPLWTRLEDEMPRLLRGDTARLTPVIEACCRIKAQVVSADEREQGLRRILNFGHTVGHALEAATHYRLLRHGEAVAYGMRAVSALAVERKLWPPADHDRLCALLDGMGPLPSLAGVPAATCLDAMSRDKKVVAGRLHFVLPTAMGATTIVDDVTRRELRRVLGLIGVR